MSRMTQLPPVNSTIRPITIENLLAKTLGARKLEICSVMLSGVYKPTNPQKKLSTGRKIYNIKRAIAYHSKKDHRDDILKIYYTRLLAQFSDGSLAVNRAEEILLDEQQFFSTTIFSTLLLDIVELQAHINLLNCINDFQETNHPNNLQLDIRKCPRGLDEIFELLPFPRDLLADSILNLEERRFRVYTNVSANLSHLYAISKGLTIEAFDEESITYRELPKGHVISFNYGRLPYNIRDKRTRSEVIEYTVNFDNEKLSDTYSKLKPWTSTIPEGVIMKLNCFDRVKLIAGGTRFELNSCKDNLCICKTALFRRIQLLGGCSDLDFLKLLTTYRFCSYALCFDKYYSKEDNIDKVPAISLSVSGVIPWHALNRGSIIK